MKRKALQMAALLFLGGALNAQMEKRDIELYERLTFVAAYPAILAPAPELTLKDIDGRAWSLSALRGKYVVIIKGGYT